MSAEESELRVAVQLGLLSNMDQKALKISVIQQFQFQHFSEEINSNMQKHLTIRVLITVLLIITKAIQKLSKCLTKNGHKLWYKPTILY